MKMVKKALLLPAAVVMLGGHASASMSGSYCYSANAKCLTNDGDNSRLNYYSDVKPSSQSNPYRQDNDSVLFDDEGAPQSVMDMALSLNRSDRSDFYHSHYGTDALHNITYSENNMSESVYSKSLDEIDNLVKERIEERVNAYRQNKEIDYSVLNNDWISKYSIIDMLDFDGSNWNWVFVNEVIRNMFIQRPFEGKVDLYGTQAPRTCEEFVAHVGARLAKHAVDLVKEQAGNNETYKAQLLENISRAARDIHAYLKPCLFGHIRNVAQDFSEHMSEQMKEQYWWVVHSTLPSGKNYRATLQYTDGKWFRAVQKALENALRSQDITLVNIADIKMEEPEINEAPAPGFTSTPSNTVTYNTTPYNNMSSNRTPQNNWNYNLQGSYMMTNLWVNCMMMNLQVNCMMMNPQVNCMMMNPQTKRMMGYLYAKQLLQGAKSN